MESVALLIAVAIAAIVVLLIAVLFWYRTKEMQSSRRITTGAEGMVGQIGVVRRAVEIPTPGQVFVHGELWRALPETEEQAKIPEGAEVEVVRLEGLTAIVRPTARH